MCGIYGAIGNINTDKLKVLKLYNESRGGDASGFYSDTQGIVKFATDSFTFLSTINIEQCSLFLGHTRFATHGQNIDNNAHPFNYGNVTLTHNGVINNYTEIAKLLGKKTYTVDTECIADLLDILGECELHRLKGTLAIAYTKNDSQLYLYRESNPLHYGILDNTFYYSSLQESLVAIGILDSKQLKENTVFKVNSLLQLEEVCGIEKKKEDNFFMNWSDYKNKSKSTKKEEQWAFDDWSMDFKQEFGMVNEPDFEELYFDLWRAASKFSYPNTEMGDNMRDLLLQAESYYFNEPVQDNI
jgi:glucosamine 6-phosphate synthetase-like amidotransferase/phosphosugar isomerase protein